MQAIKAMTCVYFVCSMFHDLRHTFATTALEHGMDAKTLSAVVGHTSVATTLNVYTHITDDMLQAAAKSIDYGIAKSSPQRATEDGSEERPAWTVKKPAVSDFQPYKGQHRKAGTECVSQIGEHLFEGRYSPRLPGGRRYVKNIYASTREECEAKLTELIVQMKAEIKEIKAGKKSA